MVTRITATKIGDMFDQVVDQRKSATYLVFKDKEYSYEYMHQQVNKIAKSLLRMGVKKGEHVAIWMVNRPEWICFALALYKIGAVVVTVNTQFHPEEVKYIFNQSDATTIVFAGSFRQCAYGEMITDLIPELADCEPGKLMSPMFPCLKNVIALDAGDIKKKGFFDWNDMLKLGWDVTDKELADAQKAVIPEDPALIIYTSGTTGNPKGAVATQKAIMIREKTYNEWFRVTSDDVVWCGTPLFYIFAAVTGTLGTIRAGAKLVLMESFDPGEALGLIEKYKCTVINAVSTNFIMMLGHPNFDQFDLSSCRTGIMGGSPMPVLHVRNVIEKMVPNIVSCWGLTECVTNGTCSRYGDSAEKVSTTVGVALPDNEVLVFDPDTDEALPPGVQGEIRMRSDANMMGYYNMPEATKKAYGNDGWLRTDDLGIMTEDGYFKITGRITDMFITGGKNVYPAEIENCISQHPAVKAVEVVGVPDPRLSEVGMVFIILKDGMASTEQEILDFCQVHLARFKIPRYVRFVTEYPLTVTGKVQKFKLKETGRIELGLRDIFDENNNS